jgi:hypothetical protein
MPKNRPKSTEKCSFLGKIGFLSYKNYEKFGPLLNRESGPWPTFSGLRIPNKYTIIKPKMFKPTFKVGQTQKWAKKWAKFL